MAGGAAIESESKRQKQNGDEEELVDWFNNLPDALLPHILSFLPIKEAVKTCILSKRWQFSWTSVSKIEFIEDDIMPSRFLRRNGRKGPIWFKNFVEGVMTARGSSVIKVFKISFFLHELRGRPLIRPLSIQSWISKAVMHNVEELDLRLSGSEPIALPQPLYTCGTLRVLKLGRPFILEVPDTVCLKSLKSLHLDQIKSYDGSILNKILSSCELEELFLKRYWEDNGWASSCICSTSLKYLSIYDWSRDPNAANCSVIVDTPQLKRIFLSIQQGSRKSYTLKRSPYLYEANIETRSALDSDVFIMLLQSISNVEMLTFFPLNQDVLDSDHYQTLPVFYNVKRVEFELEEDSWKHVPHLLERLPNLETLVLEFKHVDHEWHEPDNVAQCLCLSSHLTGVGFDNFKGSDIEMQVVEYLLKNGMVLDEISIYSHFTRYATRSRDDVFKSLLMFPRASSKCQVEFLDT